MQPASWSYISRRKLIDRASGATQVIAWADIPGAQVVQTAEAISLLVPSSAMESKRRTDRIFLTILLFAIGVFGIVVPLGPCMIAGSLVCFLLALLSAWRLLTKNPAKSPELVVLSVSQSGEVWAHAEHARESQRSRVFNINLPAECLHIEALGECFIKASDIPEDESLFGWQWIIQTAPEEQNSTSVRLVASRANRAAAEQFMTLLQERHNGTTKSPESQELSGDDHIDTH